MTRLFIKGFERLLKKARINMKGSAVKYLKRKTFNLY